MKHLLLALSLCFTSSFILGQAPNANYELVWQDEFNEDQLDASKWEIRYPGVRRDAVNTDACVSLQKGYLALRTQQVDDTIYTAMIGSQRKFEATYGYYEIRCILPQDEGHWAAFWLQTPIMGKFIGEPAKAGAEIDIFEYLPNNPKHIHHTVHWDGYETHHKSVHKLIRNRKFNPKTWHTFGVEWTPESYTFYIDGEATFKTNKGVSQRKQYIILSLEVGAWAGNIAKASLPDYYIIDYVRVYQQKSHSD